MEIFNVNKELDDLRVGLHNLLRICCSDDGKSSAAIFLMNSMIAHAGLEIAKKIDKWDAE